MACNGMGWIIVRSRNPEGQRIDNDEDCPECDGTGSDPNETPEDPSHD